MIKTLLIRLCGLLIAAVTFPPALVAVLKGTPLFSHFHHSIRSPFWRWIWSAMPAIRYPIQDVDDFLRSLPGFLAVVLLGVGLAVAFVRRKRIARRRWEDDV